MTTISIDGETVGAVRLLVRVLTRRSASALPLLTRRRLPEREGGLRVTRRVVCALEPPSAETPVEYKLAASGSPGSVQWLVDAEGIFFVTATKIRDDVFLAQAYMEVTQNANAWKRYMCSELAGPIGPRLTFESTTTPLKRKRVF